MIITNKIYGIFNFRFIRSREDAGALEKND